MTNKYYCGLDLHKNFAGLCVLDQKENTIKQVRVKIEILIQFLANQKDYHLATEASGGVFDAVARLKESDHRQFQDYFRERQGNHTHLIKNQKCQ